MVNVTPVILCGGSGTRLWPLSRSGFPKQFLSLTGKDTLFQQAVKRFSELGGQDIAVAKSLIVANEDHRFIVTEQMREIGIELGSILLEPSGRNTAPALTLAALTAQQGEVDPVLIVVPADQIVTNIDEFKAAMQSAIREAMQGGVVVLGVVPDCPETGYGYIYAQCPELGLDSQQPLSVLGFKEKPNEATAKEYIKQGNYYWNAGIFVLKASVWLKALRHCRPDIAQATQVAWDSRTNDDLFIRPNGRAFEGVPSESIDYAVMEKLASFDTCSLPPIPVTMVPLDAGWSDLGSWDAVWSVLPKDETGNRYLGDVLAVDCRNTLVKATNRLVSLVGVQDLIVIETSDAVLVTNRDRSQDVKYIVEQLKTAKREEHLLHRKVHRPWGWYDSLDEDTRFKVKRIQVKPGASLSLQKHNHRAEHWIVVTGTAEITNGEKVFTLTENQSTYIEQGRLHRLANPGTIPLEIIEVQSGKYLGEDDIVRIVDIYGRK